MCEGWIKSYRSQVDWRWFRFPATAHLWHYLLLAAEYEKREIGKMIVERGQLLTTISDISEATGLSLREIRTGLQRLEETGEIMRKSTNKNTLITLVKYEEYQAVPTNERQTKDKRKTNLPIKERNKEVKNKDIGQNFDHFWEQYPKKMSKEQARKTWNKLSLEHDLDLILEGLERAKKYDSRFRDKQYTPHASTWLNARGWEDNFTENAAGDYLEIIRNGTNSTKVQEALIKWAKMRQARDGLLTEDTIALALEQVRQLANTEDEAVAIINQSTIAGWPMFYKRKE